MIEEEIKDILIKQVYRFGENLDRKEEIKDILFERFCQFGDNLIWKEKYRKYLAIKANSGLKITTYNFSK